jgi:Flp pilus assembly CpaF family ATPase
MNLLLAGGTGSGKTTLLNVLASFIPANERIVTIEDTPELKISHYNSVRMQTKPQSPTLPAINSRELLANALRMRPDRIIIGECRRAEAMDMLQAMNTGHEGSMTTIHANSPRDAITRLETLCMTSGIDMPLQAIRKQIASTIDVIIETKRFRDGIRRVVAITEVTGMEGDTVTLQDIYSYENDVFKASGLVPALASRLKDHGIELPQNLF